MDVHYYAVSDSQPEWVRISLYSDYPMNEQSLLGPELEWIQPENLRALFEYESVKLLMSSH